LLQRKFESRRDDRFGSITAASALTSDVRFTPKSCRDSRSPARPLWAKATFRIAEYCTRSADNLQTCDKAFLLAVNITKLPSVPRQILKDIPRSPNTAGRDD
jgi:hypothetical protein